MSKTHYAQITYKGDEFEVWFYKTHLTPQYLLNNVFINSQSILKYLNQETKDALLVLALQQHEVITGFTDD